MNDKEAYQDHQSTSRPLPKGILSFVAGRDPNSECDNSCVMLHFPHNPDSTKMDRIRRRKRSSHTDIGFQDLECICTEKSYRPSDAEFTLLFFCELNCAHCRRFTFILADFLKNASSSSMENTYQLICVLNDDISKMNARNIHNGSIISHLQSEIELWHLGFNHINRLAILRMLSITRVPSLVVIDNKTGRVITSNGLEAVEWCSEGKSSSIFSSWRNGESAVPWRASVSQLCSIS